MDYISLVKQIRAELSLSQEDLARLLGVSFATINRWETGKNRPSRMAIRTLQAFCRQRHLDHIIGEVASDENQQS